MNYIETQTLIVGQVTLLAQTGSFYAMKLLILQIFSCATLTGLIWTVQILHYPAFNHIPEVGFQEFHRFHTKTISFLVMPLMTLEFASSVALILYSPDSKLLMINFIGVLLIWVSTFFVSVPLHNQLSRAKSTRTIQRLILTNWLRTMLWSARLCLLLFLLGSAWNGQLAQTSYGFVGRSCDSH